MSTRLTLIRHAPTLTAGRCFGQTDVETTIPSAEAAAQILEALGAGAPTMSAVWSSPLARCAAPAALIADHLGVPHHRDARVLELHHGRFEGRLWSEVEATDAEQLAHWMEHWQHTGPPRGESAQDLEARVRAWWQQLHGDALLIAHAGVARALRVVVDGTAWPVAMSIAVPHLAVDRVFVRD
jgi:alpha-ribazole phosphatase